VTYVRFVVGGDGENFHRLDGPFRATSRLSGAEALEPYEREWLDSVVEWFNQNLPCPPFQKMLERGSWTYDAVCWFRSDAHAMLDRMWDIVALLKENAVLVRFVATTDPGRIVYSDDFQIVAEAPKKPRR
jgi:hypothetical protein